LTLTHGKQPTAEDIKKGFEMIRNFALGGLVPPLTITAADHEGGGWVQIFQVKGEGFQKETPWFRAYRKLVVDTAGKTAATLASK
jgi:branched-chain amino acid transport system substrate-binding protein